MPGFFNRLAQRTLGVGAVARPDIAPAWANVRSTDPDDGGLSDGAEEKLDRLDSARVARSGPPVSSSVFERERRDLYPDDPLVAGRELRTATADPLLSSLSSGRESSARVDQRFLSHPLVEQRPAGTPRQSKPVAEVQAASGGRDRAARPVSPPHLSTASLPAAVRPSPAPPTISISIGRIEVGTPTKPTQAERPSSAGERARHLRSLESYLRERNEGKA